MKPKFDEAELAGTGRRFVALFIDGLVLGIVSLIIGAVSGGGLETSGTFQFLLTIVYTWYFLTRKEGQTPGKKIMKVRVVKLDGSPLSDGDAILRTLVSMVSGAVILLGYLWAFADSRNQTWHDKVVGTLVVVDDGLDRRP